MKYEALSMPGTSMISSPESSEIMDFLTLITPEKHQWWGRAVQNQLAVDFRPVINLQGFGGLYDTDLAGDIDVCLSAVKEQFDLEKVIVSGIKGYRGAYTGSFNRHSFNGIVLNPSEAGRLYKAVSGDSFDDVRYVYVLSGSEKITSVFRVRAPGNSKVKDIISFIGGKEQYIFNPLTCREIDLDGMIGPDTSLIAVSDKDRRLDSFGAGVLGRPSIRRKLSFRQVNDTLDSQRPCSNCLSCAAICPAGLSPSILYHFARSGAEDLDSLGAKLCFQCGLCSFICPSNIPLSTGIGGINADAP